MNKVRDKLPALADEEYAASMEVHPFFASAHEGYSVLLEEVEEAEKEMRDVRVNLDVLWRCVRHDNPEAVKKVAARVVGKALNLAAEAIQVMAMGTKIIDSLDHNKKVRQ